MSADGLSTRRQDGKTRCGSNRTGSSVSTPAACRPRPATPRGRGASGQASRAPAWPSARPSAVQGPHRARRRRRMRQVGVQTGQRRGCAMASTAKAAVYASALVRSRLLATCPRRRACSSRRGWLLVRCQPEFPRSPPDLHGPSQQPGQPGTRRSGSGPPRPPHQQRAHSEECLERHAHEIERICGAARPTAPRARSATAAPPAPEPPAEGGLQHLRRGTTARPAACAKPAGRAEAATGPLRSCEPAPRRRGPAPSSRKMTTARSRSRRRVAGPLVGGG